MKDKKIQFISCPVCVGSGKGKFGFSCENCGGIGLGVFYKGRFFYWEPKLSASIIELERARKKAELFLNLSAYALGLAGLIALGLWVYMAADASAELGAFAFWREKHILILLFWISVIADMFVFYRLTEESFKKDKIKPFKYEELKKANVLPNNWAELKKSKLKTDTAKGFGERAFKAAEDAYILAGDLRHGEAEVIHLFFTLLATREAAALFSRLNVDGNKLMSLIKKQLQAKKASDAKPKVSNNLKEALIEAYISAYDLKMPRADIFNLLYACAVKDRAVEEILYELEAGREKIYNAMLWFIVNEKMMENYRTYRKMARFKPGSSMDRAYTAVATPVLDHFSYDLTRAAKWGKLPFCVARDEEIENIFRQIESGRHGAILVGPVGAGKNTVIDGIAQLMVREDVPKILKDKRLIELDAARLAGGATPAQAEERMLVAMDEAARAGNVALYINNLENIMGISSGAEGSLELSEVLAESLRRGGIICFASASDENYAKYIEGRPIDNQLAKISISEPEYNKTIQIIESKIGALEAKYKVFFSYNALENVVKLSQRYIHDKFLPAKAIEILNTVAIKTAQAKGENSIVAEEDIAEVISEITKIPVSKITEQESKNLLSLEEKIHNRMIDQVEAVKMVAASLRRARTQLREGKRPIASFLFLGPTGVGKTELAKSVSEVYFGNENYMIRVDMSEYQRPDSVNKMIGAEGEAGYLTEAVRKAPFSLILLDEIEKAHPDILNLFLQVMDDGRLTDGKGRTIDFTNSIIIATSNAGALYIQEEIGVQSAEVPAEKIARIKETLINEYLNKVMRPELINRFDGVTVFKPLSKEDVKSIAKLMLAKTAGLLEQKGIRLQASEAGIAILAEKGFDPKFGARPLRRLLQDEVDNMIANKILAGELARRDTVVINDNGGVEVEKAEKL